MRKGSHDVGFHHEIGGRYDSVSGGKSNTASGEVTSVCGGYNIDISIGNRWGGEKGSFVKK